MCCVTVDKKYTRKIKESVYIKHPEGMLCTVHTKDEKRNKESVLCFFFVVVVVMFWTDDDARREVA